MPTIGYTSPGDTDENSTGTGCIVLARGLVADLSGGIVLSIHARIGHSDTANFLATLWDEAGNPLAQGSNTAIGVEPVTEFTFGLFPETGVPGSDTYFYFSVQCSQDAMIFQYESSLDSFFYQDNISYDPPTVSPTDNHAGTPCIWIVYGTPPVNVTPPVIEGDPQVGQILTVTDNGTWTNSPSSYSYQWYLDDGLISGETASSYAVLDGDEGGFVNCKVTATNGDGPSAATASNYIGPIAPSGVPVNIVAPVVSGASTAVGVTLSTDDGTWTGSPSSFTYQWKRDTGAGPVSIPGETTSSYVTMLSDVGATIYSEVTAYN